MTRNAATRVVLPGVLLFGCVAAAVVTARAEDAGMYAFIQSEARNRAPARFFPAPAAVPPVMPDLRRIEPRATFVRLPAEERDTAIKMPLKAKDTVENPVPQLLRDKTLRAGDIVIFPDGPRVFQGDPGSRHRLADFVSPGRAKVAAATRKSLARIVVGRNDAWSTDLSTKVAGDVDVTASVKGQRARR